MSVIFKVIIVGDSKSGKTCLYERLKDDTYLKTNAQRVGSDIFTHEQNGISFKIWDIDNHDKCFHNTYATDAELILICVPADRNNLDSVEQWYHKACDFFSESKAIFLFVATKMDVLQENDESFKNGLGQKVQKLAKKDIHIVPDVIFTSSKEMKQEVLIRNLMPSMIKKCREILQVDEIKNELKEQLQKYTNRIEGYEYLLNGYQTDLKYPFMKEAQEINRMANYNLAKDLYEYLNDGKSHEEIYKLFAKNYVKNMRLNFFQDKSKSNGINSDELNAALRYARKESKRGLKK